MYRSKARRRKVLDVAKSIKRSKLLLNQFLSKCDNFETKSRSVRPKKTS